MLLTLRPLQGHYFLLTKDAIFQPVAGWLCCLYWSYRSSVLHNLSLCTGSSAPVCQLTTEIQLLLNHRGLSTEEFDRMFPVSQWKGVKSLGKRLSNPLVTDDIIIHPFPSHVAKNLKTCFCLVSITAKQRDIESVALVRRAPRKQHFYFIFFIHINLLDTLSERENAEWGQHLAQIKSCFDFLEWKLAKQPHLKWHCKMICSESLGRADWKTLPHLGESTPRWATRRTGQLRNFI